MSVGEVVAVYLRLHILATYAGIVLQRFHLYLIVKVSYVAHDSLVGHRGHVLYAHDVDVACRGHEDVALRASLLHGYHLESLHGSLQCADGVNLGHQHTGTV